ncbi:MAG: 3-hydroxyacyl-ACP dehydratase FabZ [Trueperaceae bacterium]
MVDVRRLLPHRYPFLMVDAFVHQDGDAFECTKNVSHNEPHFAGHFPEEPVMPGVLILEALAQAAGVALAVREGATAAGADAGAEGGPAPRIAYLTGVDGARFRRKVVPGEVLRLTGTITRFRRGLCTVDAVALVGGEVAAQATLSFAFAR